MVGTGLPGDYRWTFVSENYPFIRLKRNSSIEDEWKLIRLSPTITINYLLALDRLHSFTHNTHRNLAISHLLF